MKTETHREIPCENRGRNRSNKSIGQRMGMARISSKNWNLGRGQGKVPPSEPPKRNQPY